jgi:hypothetical protein
LPRLDWQPELDHDLPPVRAVIPPRRLMAITLLGVLLWVGVVLVTLAVLA